MSNAITSRPTGMSIPVSTKIIDHPERRHVKLGKNATRALNILGTASDIVDAQKRSLATTPQGKWASAVLAEGIEAATQLTPHGRAASYLVGGEIEQASQCAADYGILKIEKHYGRDTRKASTQLAGRAEHGGCGKAVQFTKQTVEKAIGGTKRGYRYLKSAAKRHIPPIIKKAKQITDSAKRATNTNLIVHIVLKIAMTIRTNHQIDRVVQRTQNKQPVSPEDISLFI